MENKELVKQLEGVGFVKAKTTLSLKIKGGFICDFFMRNRILIIYNSEKVSKKYVSCTFEGILSLIKEHTGVDLTKKTKREEIEELKTGLKALVEKAEDSGAVFDAMLKGYFMSIVDTVQAQGAKIESQNDAIEQNKKDAHRANDRLTMVLRRLKVLGVWKDEECDKQASEMQAEGKKVFSVGDSVVLNESAKVLLKETGTGMNINKQYPIERVVNSSALLFTEDDCENWFQFHYLEHAPAESPKEKALEWGDFKIFNGKKVLVAHKLISTAVIYFKDGSWDEVNFFDLKPL